MVIVPIHSRVTQARRTGAPRSVVACGIGYLYLRTGSGNSEEAEEPSCQCSAKQRPITGIPCVRAVGPCDLFQEENLGAHLLSLRRR